MRLVSFLDGNGTATWGAIIGAADAVDLGAVDAVDLGAAEVVDLGALLGARFPTVRALLEADALDQAQAALADSPATVPLASLVLLPPVTDPRRILCAGVNYDEHRVETGRDPSANPTIFTRYPSSLVGHGAPLVKPRESDAFDYEGELAVVIGRAGRRVPAADALGHVAGYSAFMDGSVRDWQRMTSQFTPGKNFDSSGSFGPWLLTADEVADPQALHLRTLVDGEVLQEAGTDLMIFTVADLIAFCSTFTTLEPGDVIATGTPGGVGDRRTPPRYLVPGSQVTVDITGVGRLENRVISD